MNHLVALSGGKDSTAMALRLRELYPDVDYTYLTTPTGDELPAMVEHWLNLQTLLGKPLTYLTSGHSLGSLIEHHIALPNWRQRWCTRILKIEPFQAYLAEHRPATIYVGFRADEEGAREGVEYGELTTRKFPMIEWGWGLAEVMDYLDQRGVVVPERTDCGACFFQTLGEWYVLWRDHPDRWERYERWEELTGHTFRSPSRDTQPAGLAELRAKFESGYEPRLSKMHERKVMCSTCAH